ncbi:M56 family metallopeptidase [Paenibacillus hodogayensis]|uniref:M56 family metallopeptidase n=1 Tax=Paenibacillus hodogayensis TaxID=279208 RepID=A0ABV5VT46_9BACL
MMWHTRSQKLLWASTSIAGLVLAQMIAYALQLLLDRSFGFNVFSVCSGWLHAIGMPALAYGLDALIAYTFLYGAWQLARQLYWTRRTWSAFRMSADMKKTEQLAQKFGLAGSAAPLVVASRKPLALTIGIARPRIVVSDGLLRLLDDNELMAVLDHERHHQASRDPFASFVLSWLASVVWYLPILRWTSEQYRIAREVLADQFAMSRSGSMEPVASALLKLLRLGRPDAPRQGVVYASFAETSINYRLQQLIDPHAAPQLRLPLRPMVVSVHAAAFLTAAFVCMLW